MTRWNLLCPTVLLLSGCMATTPTQTSESSSDAAFLAWYCYGSYSDMRTGGQNFVFYTYSDTNEAYVNVHGEDVPANFSMDGLDAQYLFGPNGERGQYDYYLIIEPDGDAKYGDYDSEITFPKSFYDCRKAAKSR